MLTERDKIKAEESDWVRRCCALDPPAQRLLYERYKGRMMAFCLRYFRTKDLAEEVFQEGFIRFFQKIEQYDPVYPLFPYMKKIFLRAGLNYLRKFVSDKNSTFSINEFHADSIADEETTLPNLQTADLLNIIELLPKEDATILQLALVDGLTHEEIGQMLDINPGNSRVRLLRSRKKFITLAEKHLNYN
jgi:RNA polymerase sigma factor (sigma-70 family)